MVKVPFTAVVDNVFDPNSTSTTPSVSFLPVNLIPVVTDVVVPSLSDTFNSKIPASSVLSDSLILDNISPNCVSLLAISLP